MSYFSDKKVFITGGSAGIGRSLALSLAAKGAHVAIAARGQERLDQTLADLHEVTKSGDQRHTALSVDVTDAEAMRQAVAKAVEELGGLDIVICNSGYSKVKPILELTDDEVSGLMNVNYLGHANTVRAAAPYLVEQGRGDVCLVSSMLALFSTWGYAAYSASKFAIRGLAEGLHHELKPKGIRVTQFFPNTTETPGLELENEDKDPVTWAIEKDSAFSSIFSADQVADGILKTIERGRFEGTIGFESWLIRLVYGLAPSLGRMINDDEIKKAHKKVASQ